MYCNDASQIFVWSEFDYGISTNTYLYRVPEKKIDILLSMYLAIALDVPVKGGVKI